MKYLKLFESIFGNLTEEDKIELQDFCETHLTYLIDEGFELDVFRNPLRDSMTIVLKNHEMIWDDFIDYLIPFLVFLQKKYDLINIADHFYRNAINVPNKPNNTDNIQFYIKNKMTTLYANISHLIKHKLEINHKVSHVFLLVNKKES
jgi:hypothetical protein